jgi:hypothetical protein
VNDNYWSLNRAAGAPLYFDMYSDAEMPEEELASVGSMLDYLPTSRNYWISQDLWE